MTDLMQGNPQSESQSVRSRSLGGCATCRTRHVKCDEGRPTCEMCKYFGVKCGGYERSIFFDFEKHADDGTLRFRRPLFTEEERKCMSRSITSSVPPKSALRTIAQIDSECESEAALQDIQINRGPFGVFKLNLVRESSPSEHNSAETEDISSPAEFSHGNDDWMISAETALSPWTQAIFQSILDQSEQISVSPSLDFLSMRDSGRIQEVFDEMSIPELNNFEMPASATQPYLPTQFLQFNQPPVQDNMNSISSYNKNIPPNTLLLIEHYATTVIGSLTPFRHSKTPWHILFLPLAKSCLAALMLGEQLDHGSLCVFYGTLAISAFSLGGISQSQILREEAQTYKRYAKEHARLILKSAYVVPKVTKYKNILMGLITMVQVSMLSRNHEQTEYYLLETEKFIRLKGLNRRKSRKVRLLHHCYAFARVLHESMFKNGLNSAQRLDVAQAIESSGLVIYGSDQPTFRLSGWSNLEQEMLIVKDLPDAENDLHLERPGIFPYTMYPEIFGVPEPWIFLLSQVIRLGNEKEAAEQQDVSNPLSLKDFASRAKDLEKYINRLQRPPKSADVNTSSQQQGNQQVFENMLDGMQHALEIYFYRRIYNVPASMLQQKVVNVRDSLMRCENADANVVYGSSGLLWAAFIAACEAEDLEVQASFSNWFTQSAQRSGLPSSTNTLERIEKVWQEKRNGTETSLTWLDLTQDPSLLPQRL